MADRRITEHTELAEQPHANDLIEIVDVSDTTDAASGTNKKIKRANYLGTVLAATTASFTTADETKLDGIEAAADVTDAANVNAAGAVMESDYDAHTILAATSDNTPAALTVGEQTLVGRITAGNIAALTATQARTLLNVEDGATADQSAAEILAALLTVDGAGSGLDADLLDGSSSAAFVKFTDNPSDLTPDTLVTETGTSFTLSSTHDGRTVICSNASAVTVTIPTDAGDDLRDGFRAVLVSTGAGGVTLSTSGITLLPTTPNKTVATGEGIYVEKSTAANTWVVLGGTAA